MPSKQHASDLPGWKKFRQESECLLPTAALKVREQALAHFQYRDCPDATPGFGFIEGSSFTMLKQTEEKIKIWQRSV